MRTPYGTASYDDNGNLIRILNGDSETYWAYDDENQLTYYYDMSLDRQFGFAYDGMGRLRRSWEWVWDDGEETFVETHVTNYIYDGKRVIQERNDDTGTVSYTLGSDLSGSMEGAGGIGGILARSEYASSAWTNHAFYHTDGNGNVTQLIDVSQSSVASYRYDPFGNTISQSGSLANTNLYRFSSKRIHPVTAMYYYGYRWYMPTWQRWLNRDPLGELGADGPNLYASLRNNPPNRIDRNGKESWGAPFFPPRQPSTEGPFDCGNRIKNEVWEKYGEHRPMQGSTKDLSARRAHCIAHCRILRECPGGGATSWIGGFGKEVLDQIKQWRGLGGDGYDSGDMGANSIGRQCGRQKNKTCEELCDEAFNNGSLYPPPPDPVDWGTLIAYPPS